MEYSSREEKIEVLKGIFGSWPPPFEPPWCVQVSQGRCGSNGLWEIVNSFFPEATYDPCYEDLSIPEVHKQIKTPDDWIPASNKKQYLYYNMSDLAPWVLSTPILLYFLEGSPKIIHLIREDHLTRAISYYYIKRIWATEKEYNRKLSQDERIQYFQMPVNLQELDEYILFSIIDTHYIKKVIDHFVSVDRLLRISHFDIFYASTSKKLKELVAFLECDPSKTPNIRFEKQTRYEYIPNRQAILAKYERDLIEYPYWLPSDLDTEEVEVQVTRRFHKFLRLNLSQNVASEK